jgi:hypothetical protein
MRIFKKKKPIPSSSSSNENKPDLLTGLCTNLGCCTLLLQLVESQLSMLMNHLEIKEKGKPIDWVTEGKSLGYRIKEVSKTKLLPNDIELRVDNFRNARNAIIHGLVNEKDFSIFDNNKIANTYLQVRELRIEANSLVTFFNSVLSESAFQSIMKKEQASIASVQSIISELTSATPEI